MFPLWDKADLQLEASNAHTSLQGPLDLGLVHQIVLVIVDKRAQGLGGPSLGPKD